MTGEVNLGDNLDVACLCIVNNLLEVVECVVHATAILGIVIEILSVGVAERSLADSTDLGQLWIFGNLHAPALVIGQVPVETVHLVENHDVENLLYLLLVEEVACDVEHVATVSKQRLVVDLNGRDCPFYIALQFACEEFAWEQLCESLQTVEVTAECRCLDYNLLLACCQSVALGCKGSVSAEPDLTVGGCFAGLLNLEIDACRFLELCCECLGMLLHLLALVGNCCELCEVECLLTNSHVQWLWDDRNLAHVLECYSFNELHGVVLVVLVPKTHTAVFIWTTPKVH